MSVVMDPIEKFTQWYSEALKAEPAPDAMALATASLDGLPSVRMVLLKKFDRHGLVFYTNLNSLKATQLNNNPHAACCFYWHNLQKQVRIEGTVEPVSTDEADAYFRSRPRDSQISSWTSKQSSPLESFPQLMSEFNTYQKQFAAKDIPRPPHWSGFRIKPSTLEFWTAGEHRLHPREIYHWENEQWEYGGLLYP